MNNNKKICAYCFELILPYDKYESVKLPDGTEIIVHTMCIEQMMEENDERE